MSARTDREAVRHFADTLHTTLACVVEPHLYEYERADISAGQIRVLTLYEPIALDASAPVSLDVQHGFTLVDGAGAERRVTSQEYIYTLRDGTTDYVLIAFHWHPLGVSRVRHHHVHVHASGALGAWQADRLHVPTSRILLEDVVQFCIEELAARPRRADWQQVLEDNRAEFRRATR